MGPTAQNPTIPPPAGDTSTTPLRGNKTNVNLKRPHTASTSGKPPTPSTGANPTKKRPYRRTKRPKNYCDKSTVTTVTTPTRTPGDGSNPNQSAGNTNPDGTNVYDAVLGECEDLLRASTEAQRLGRLKMASAYQLLLHTRLVGLGKRFDRSAMMVDQQKAKQEEEAQKQLQHQKRLQMDSDSQDAGKLTLEEGGDGSTSASNSRNDDPNNAQTSDNTKDKTNPDQTASDSTVPVALQQLRSILPGNLEMDASMMEHLARAAVELHHQRTGRKKSADGLLASPLNGGLTTSPMVNTETARDSDTAVTEDTNSGTKTTRKSSVAWTPSEITTVHKALKEGKDPYTIATTLLPSKTVAQVHAFVKNQQQLAKVTQLQQRQVTSLKSDGTSAVPSDQPNLEKSPPTDESKGATTNHRTGETTGKTATVGSTESENDPSNKKTGKKNVPSVVKRGGRGRKPPTTAMNTVPNVMMDVRALLRRANNNYKNSTTGAATDADSEAKESQN